MSRRDEVRHLAERVLAEFGRVDILINNAGGNRLGAIDKITDEDWDSVIEVNLTSCMVLTRALVPQMKQRRWGRIIHISSIMGLASKEERDVYSATKSALIGLARANALDLGAFGITVNCLAPGPFLTDLPGKLAQRRAEAGLCQPHRPGALGRTERTGGAGTAFGQRGRWLHHWHGAGRRRRNADQDVLAPRFSTACGGRRLAGSARSTVIRLPILRWDHEKTRILAPAEPIRALFVLQHPAGQVELKLGTFLPRSRSVVSAH